MSLMNDALRSLDDSRQHNNRNDKAVRHMHNVLDGNQTAVDQSTVAWKAKNDSFDDVNYQEEYYFYKTFILRLFSIIFFILIMIYVSYTGYIFINNDKVYDNQVFEKSHMVDEIKVISDERLDSIGLGRKSLGNEELGNKELSDKGLDSKYLVNEELVGEESDNKYLDGEMLDDKDSYSELPKKTKNISWLNDKGYAALANDFLSTPKDDNAMSYFQQVLAIDESNVLALQGVDSVYRRYQKLIASNVERRNWLSAQTMLDRFLAIGGDEKSVVTYKKIIFQNLNNKKQSKDLSSDSLLSGGSVKSYLSVEKSRYQVEQEALFRSLEWVKKNQIQKGIDELSAILNTQSYLTKSSAEFLFDLYLRLGDIDAARGVSRHVKNVKKTILNNNAWDTVYENARIEQVENGDLAALAVLHNTKIEWLGESSARLYAGLLQKNGDYALAQKIYRHLIKVYDKNVTYWLGYGVSSDALGQSDSALIGYQKTQNLGGVSSDIQSYIANRILALQAGDYPSSHLMEPSW